jgi:curved DNA-binding protein CbpA
MSINNIKDYYYILGLARNASRDEIKKAYRKLSLKFHPDQNNGDKFFEGRFRDVNEAYETLVDDIKRKVYDDKLGEINNTGTGEKNYSNTNSSQSQQSKKQQPYKPANTPPPKPSSSTPQKRKSNKAIYTVVTILLFLSPLVIRIVIQKLSEHNNSKNYSDSLQYKATQNAPHDSAAVSVKTNTDTTASYVSAPVNSGVAPALPDTSVSITVSQNDSSQSSGFKDEDGLTATDALKYFFQALNNNDCNTAWSMTYNATWLNDGKDWFCSAAAFGGVKKVLIRNMYPVTQIAEAEIYVDYYAEDAYNGNKCFKQNITLQKIAFSDRARWKITKMKNVEEPVVCNGN